jgi:hypothetical protein
MKPTEAFEVAKSLGGVTTTEASTGCDFDPQSAVTSPSHLAAVDAPLATTPWLTGALETFTLEHSIVAGEGISKLINHNSDRIVAAIGAPSCLLDRCGDGLVVALCELVSGR